MNTEQTQGNNLLNFGNWSVASKLIAGFGAVILCIIVLVGTVISKLSDQEALQTQVVESRFPTTIAGNKLINGINSSLAALRGYMILNKPQFKSRRMQAWGEIDIQLNLLTEKATEWTNQENINRLSKIKTLMDEFRDAQALVEDVANTPNEQPGLQILVDDAAPLAAIIMSNITKLIDIEKNQPATMARKTLLSNLADSRGSFAMSLATIRAFLLTGESKWISEFENLWNKNNIAFQKLNNQSQLFTASQRQAFDQYVQKRQAFSVLPNRMFDIRSSEHWNEANYLLGTQAAPKAKALLTLLNEMVSNQNELVKSDAAALQANSSDITNISFIATFFAIMIAGIIAWFITKLITSPLKRAISFADAIAIGNLTNTISSNSTDEFGQLLTAISRMQEQLKEREITNNDVTAKIEAIGRSQAAIEFDMQGTITTANENFLKTMGYTLDEVQGKHHSIFVEPEFKASAEYREFWESMNRGEFASAEYKRIGKGGKEIWIQASYNPILDLDGNPTKVVKYASDISAQKLEAVENLKIANISSALKLCNANVMLADNDLNIVYMNDGIQVMLKGNQSQIRQALPQFDVDTLIGTCVDDFHKNPAHQRSLISTLSKTNKTRIKVAGLTFELTTSPWTDTEGERLGTVVEWYDMTEDLAAQAKEKAMSDANARIKSALDKCNANVMMADNDLNIIYTNDAVQQMMQGNEAQLRTVLPSFNASKLIGTCVDDFHANPAHQRAMIGNLTSTYNTKLKLGSLTFDLIATPVFDDDGNRLGTVVEWQDITEALAAQEAERAISAANARIKIALDKCQANVMMADTDLNIIYMNDSVEKMMSRNEAKLRTALPNFNVSRLIGTCVDDFHKNPAHQRGMLEGLKEVYKTRLPIASLTFELIATPVFDDDGTRLGSIVEWSDITEELATQNEERRIADENSRIKQALDNVATNTMIANADNEIIYLNAAVNDMMLNAEKDIQQVLPNFSAKDLMGQCMDTFHKSPAHQQGLISRLESTYSTEIKVGTRTFGLIANPIHAEAGERIGTVVEWNDRTEEVAIEKEIADLIGAAGEGDLSSRINEDGKSGFFLNLAGGLNQLVGIAEGVIEETATMLDAMAHGDLTKRIDSDYQGAFDKLKTDANSTAEKLTEVISRINNSAAAVSSGSQEIAQGNTDLSQRTEEQASSLEETASSMEQMTSTVRQNADNAKVANDLAADATTKAQKGGDVVKRAVNSMAEINDSSKKIADIIGVIDEIAFQTNLLALNAAVEAARAGEMGRGFAVVAGEVRNLAQRSAAAAKEIKDLIRDSVSKVQDGSQLVNESGVTLGEIVDAISRVTAMIGDISIASSEQSEGIEQVNKAITQMDEMTQQNAALVEEASAAGEAMADQASGMRQILGFFSTGGTAGSMASSSPALMSPPGSSSSRSAPAPVSTPAAPPTPIASSGGMDFADDDEQWEEF